MTQPNLVLRDELMKAVSYLLDKVGHFQRALEQEFPTQLCPEEVKEIREQIDRLYRNSATGPFGVPPKDIPLVKCAMLMYRRHRVAVIEAIKQKTNNDAIRSVLTVEQDAIDRFTFHPAFTNIQPTPFPHLGQFVNLNRLSELPEYRDALPQRKYDDKFGILSPASQFVDDLKYWRNRCELRRAKLAVAYLDIDHFKERLNNKYGNTKVDATGLPLFMETVERHVYGHGNAYREGGDEYLILMPNVSEEVAVQILDELRFSLENKAYPEVNVLTTVSVGVCCADADCYLTDNEFRIRADWAKEVAKEKGRNSIAGYKGIEYRKADVEIKRKGRGYDREGGPLPVEG
jgi:diguanylate cyclase (GGDEF)-like protein